jgi:1-phosphofructokinase
MITAAAVSPSLDVTYVVEELSGIQRPLEVHRVAGGKALNAARAAALLGSPVSAVAVLGGGTGSVVEDLARADGIDLRVVDGGELTRTCVSIHARADGGLTEIYEHATPVPRGVYEELLDELVATLADRPGWCLVSGGVPASLGPDALQRLAARVPTGTRLAVDSHGPALRSLLAGASPDLLKVNRAEACEVLDAPASAPLSGLVHALHARTGSLVVVTDGVAGLAATDGERTLHASLPGVVGQFPVGSGDSLLGALVQALDEGLPLEPALRRATAAGAANALVPGAARFDPATVARLADAVMVTDGSG